MNLRLYHLADVHLGKPLPATQYPAHLKASHALMRANALHNLMMTAHIHEIDAVIIAGDLFDNPTPQPADLRTAIEACDRAAPVPVIIVPGNHDHCGPGSSWNPREWPSNVTICTAAPIVRVDLPNGAAHIVAQPWTRKELKVNPFNGPDIPDIDGPGYRILVTHGSELTEQPPTWRTYAPFYAHQLQRHRPDYIALGHLHWWSLIHIVGHAPAVYPGSFAATGPDDLGPKHYASLTIEEGRPTITQQPSGAYEFYSHTASITEDDTYEDILTLIQRLAGTTGTHPVLWLRLVGNADDPTKAAIPSLHRRYKNLFAHLTIQDLTAHTPTRDDQGADAADLAQFTANLDELIEGEPHPRRLALLHAVKHHGLVYAANRANTQRGSLYQ